MEEINQPPDGPDVSDAELVEASGVGHAKVSPGLARTFISSIHRTIFPSHFVYEPPLSPNTISNLNLQPSSFNAPLVGTFSIASLNSDACPHYLALSYTWGDPTPTSTLTCDRATLMIGSNLDSALRHVRSEKEGVKIWIDAICINQKDVPEKNSQVKNMGLVYSRASRVLVWLGPDNPDEKGGKLAFEAAKDIVAESNLRLQRPDDWHTLPWVTALREITCRQWFHRAWTCQEIGLAIRATFYVGRSTIDWDTLYQAFRIIESNIPKEELESEAFYTERVTFLYRSFSGTSFRDLLLHARNRAASDPRDKVYSLLSHPAASDPKTGQPLIQVDYGKTVAVVYAEATVLMLRGSGNLDDLSFSHHKSGLPPWPSWIPKWYENPRMGWLLRGKEASNFAACGKYNFGDKLKLSARARERFHLTVPGFMIDTIEECQYMRAGKNWPAWFKWPSHGQHRRFLEEACLQVEDSALLKIFTTENGFQGIGSSQACTGYTVAVLCGGRAPYVLRAEDGVGNWKNVKSDHRRVRLVDDCYVPGLMNGEVEEMVDKGSTELESFKIF